MTVGRDGVAKLENSASGMAAAMAFVGLISVSCQVETATSEHHEAAKERPATQAETISYLVNIHHTLHRRERFYRDGYYERMSVAVISGRYSVNGNRFCTTIIPPVELGWQTCRRLVVTENGYTVLNDGDR